MPRRDLSCNLCDKAMYAGSTSLPQGKARCHACRRMEPQRGANTVKPVLTMCPWCWQIFMPHHLGGQKFCTISCGRKFQGERQRVRAPNDSHQRRNDRAKNAPGLGYSARRDLLARWKRQRRTCAYCDSLATTIDHVVPLVRGGTNYEGNLTPCCKRCNSRKTYLLIIEWRTSKRLPRMRSALAWIPKVRPPKAVKPPKPTHPCRICGADTTRRLDCSPDCSYEANNRMTRDKYRAKAGLPVDFNEPTKRWRSRYAAEVLVVQPNIRGEATQLALLW
jgi:5-methylcytosine-specific restriction endonuclease McrA